MRYEDAVKLRHPIPVFRAIKCTLTTHSPLTRTMLHLEKSHIDKTCNFMHVVSNNDVKTQYIAHK
jgi:hypothetical protein